MKVSITRYIFLISGVFELNILNETLKQNFEMTMTYET